MQHVRSQLMIDCRRQPGLKLWPPWSVFVARWQLGNLRVNFRDELIFLHVRRKVTEMTRHFEGAKGARHSEGSNTDSSILLYLSLSNPDGGVHI
jgi:hypothetical protein